MKKLIILTLLLPIFAHAQSSKPWDVPYTYGDTLPEIVVIGHVGDTGRRAVIIIDSSQWKWQQHIWDSLANEHPIIRWNDPLPCPCEEQPKWGSPGDEQRIFMSPDTVKWTPYWKPKKKKKAWGLTMSCCGTITTATTRTRVIPDTIYANWEYNNVPDTFYKHVVIIDTFYAKRFKEQSADLGIVYGHSIPWYLTKLAFFIYGVVTALILLASAFFFGNWYYYKTRKI